MREADTDARSCGATRGGGRFELEAVIGANEAKPTMRAAVDIQCNGDVILRGKASVLPDAIPPDPTTVRDALLGKGTEFSCLDLSQFPEQDIFGQCLLEFFLDQACHWTCAHGLVVTMLNEPIHRFIIYMQ